ncbi:unnamed protein product [Heligmosomoides polygyrus]|uniref:SCP domain-containing protein n=1 Tax=Heligmosomoides polygyrus TaxID=6339 RepID=A0A183FGT9_HELPZ|nr:unnamed protein product [Heligmosomoides polygyrus]
MAVLTTAMNSSLGPAVCRVCLCSESSIPYLGNAPGEPLISPCHCKYASIVDFCLQYAFKVDPKWETKPGKRRIQKGIMESGEFSAPHVPGFMYDSMCSAVRAGAGWSVRLETTKAQLTAMPTWARIHQSYCSESGPCRPFSPPSSTRLAIGYWDEDKGRRYSIRFGMHHASYLYDISWRRLECVFGHTMTCGDRLMNKSAL